MKYGEYLASIRSDFAPLFDSRDFVPYDKLKTAIESEHKDEFYKSWEESFKILCGKLKDASAKVETETEQDLFNQFRQINREALRKLMKKSDKKLGLTETNLENVAQQGIRLRMTDCALESVVQSQINPCLGKVDFDDIEIGFAIQSDDVNLHLESLEEGLRATDPMNLVGSTLGRASDDDDSTLASPSKVVKTSGNSICDSLSKLSLGSLIGKLGLAGIFFVESTRPIVADLSKSGHTQIPYIKATVIGGEALVSCVLGMLFCRRFVSPRAVVKYAPVGIFRAIGDTASIACLNYMDPSLYSTLTQSRLVLTGVVSWCCLSTKPNKLQFQAMAILTLALIAFSCSYSSSGTFNPMGLVIVMVEVCSKVGASCYLDKVLKEDDTMPVILQSATVAVGTLIASAAYCATEHKRIAEKGLFVGWSPLACALVLQILAKNWISNMVVKRFSAVVKYVVYAVATAGTFLLQKVMYQEEVSALSMVLIVIIVQAAYCFADGKSWTLQRQSDA
jgi:drug/metabolite transporter (DMT)-like permease